MSEFSEQTPNHLLVDAICYQNLEGVRAALAAGAQPDEIADQNTQPIWWQHLTQRVIYKKAQNEAKFMNDAWDLMIPLVQVTDFASPDLRYADNCNRAQSDHIGSTIILKALLEDPEFRINLEALFARHSNDADLGAKLFGGDALEKGHPFDENRRHVRTRLLSIHQRVGLRLTVPGSSFEKDVASSLSEDQKFFWCEDWQFPKLDQLPMPSEAYLEAQMAAIKNIAMGYETFQRTVRQGWASDHDRALQDKALKGLTEALDTMHSIGRARRPKIRKSPPPRKDIV